MTCFTIYLSVRTGLFNIQPMVHMQSSKQICEACFFFKKNLINSPLLNSALWGSLHHHCLKRNTTECVWCLQASPSPLWHCSASHWTGCQPLLSGPQLFLFVIVTLSPLWVLQNCSRSPESCFSELKAENQGIMTSLENFLVIISVSPVGKWSIF